MSGGKKKSGFRITSVTSEYTHGVGESPSQKGPLSTETSASPLLSNGGQSSTPSPSLPHRQPVQGRGSVDQITPTSTVSNGPAFSPTLSPSLQTHGSSSQPNTPVTIRKQSSLEQGGSGGGASRFRVVRLGQGLGEPYKRGRWTCVDVMEREMEERGLRRVIDSMRHAHSLESLETVGLGGAEGTVGGAALKPLGHMRALRAGHMVHSQGTTHLLAHCRTETSHSGPPSPTYESQHFPSPQNTPSTTRTRNIPPPLRLDTEPGAKLRATRSQPTSPGPHMGRDGPFHPSLTPIQTPSALALAQSMLGVGSAFELVGDESGSNSSMIAIDNKIEQAMDLVKTHLMLAVREEVEVLREQIKELSERNAQLERENYILRALRERD
ncbi:TSC22 domain family protein 4 [Chanos chanos]|uniref:TSC22 domain family protein 4 n=1 Tax=Chanos chanos TaxID=29144 RepID=A0A6J2VG04_CHACN|nr:TSC22 domain family protein 4 [Chanos chanos]